MASQYANGVIIQEYLTNMNSEVVRWVQRKL